jgi:hypothetical protein
VAFEQQEIPQQKQSSEQQRQKRDFDLRPKAKSARLDLNGGKTPRGIHQGGTLCPTSYPA